MRCLPTCKATAFLDRHQQLCARLLEDALAVRAVLEEAYDELEAAWRFLDS